jgi:hypothetical protein
MSYPCSSPDSEFAAIRSASNKARDLFILKMNVYMQSDPMGQGPEPYSADKPLIEKRTPDDGTGMRRKENVGCHNPNPKWWMRIAGAIV